MVDVETNAENDLSKYSAWNDILTRLHLFDLVGIDLPCNTWSRARRGKPGSVMPEPLRGTQASDIFGFAHLQGRDKSKVNQANRMLFGAYRVIRKCLRLNIAGYLENPMTSMLWKTPQVRKLLQHRHVHLIRTHLCQYGVQWRKATYILVWGCKPFQLLTCSGRGKCSRTGRPHLQLTGLQNKVFLTKQAQVSPRLFARDLIDNILINRVP